ncbi:MAG: hypothetical protein IJ800_06885 [Clostridia bacterium]|nr:hypothetical protein [Clostridia bacterium]
MNKSKMPKSECPVCGEKFYEKTKKCPKCGFEGYMPISKERSLFIRTFIFISFFIVAGIVLVILKSR